MPTPPQSESVRDTFIKEDLTAGLSWRLFIFLLIIFSTLLFGYFGMQYGYKAFLGNSISNLDEELKVLGAEVESVDQKNLLAFYSQITNIKDLLSRHVFGSNIFSFIESITHNRVAYVSFSLSVNDRQLTLEGLTDSYDNAVRQLDAYNRSNQIEKLSLDGIQFVNDIVKFNVKLTLDKKLFEIPSQSVPIIVEPDNEETTGGN